jgi:hypothetical protein
MQVFDDRFQAETGLCLEAVIKDLHEMYGRKPLRTSRKDARNVWSFITE